MISNIIEKQRVDSRDFLDLRLFDSISDPILVYDFVGNFVYVNTSAAKIYGYSRDELIGKNVCLLRGEEVVNSLDIRTQSLKNNGQDVFENFDYCKDGSIVHVRVHSYILEKGSTGLIASIIHKIHHIDRDTCNNTRTKIHDIEHYLRAVNALMTVIEVRDPYTANHQKRVANLACKIADKLELGSDIRRAVYIAGLLHDIGKVYVPNEILTRPGRINNYEFSIIKKHSEIGYNILSKLCFPWPIKDYVMQHHERMDGTGYPLKLVGKNIHLESMILAVADVVEAMASHRPYRAALGIDKALEEIKNGRGTIYHPDVVDACTRVLISDIFNFDNHPQDVIEELLI